DDRSLADPRRVGLAHLPTPAPLAGADRSAIAFRLARFGTGRGRVSGRLVPAGPGRAAGNLVMVAGGGADPGRRGPGGAAIWLGARATARLPAAVYIFHAADARRGHGAAPAGPAGGDDGHGGQGPVGLRLPGAAARVRVAMAVGRTRRGRGV